MKHIQQQVYKLSINYKISDGTFKIQQSKYLIPSLLPFQFYSSLGMLNPNSEDGDLWMESCRFA